jgi:methionyl aminopeptidase
MDKFSLKTEQELKIMAEGGAKLGDIKNRLAEMVENGVTAAEIEAKANRLIEASGGEAAFKKVEGYKWATCINVNEGIVHGIPSNKVVFETGNLVSIDIGLFYKGFYTDTSVSVGIELSPENERFLKAGREALKNAITQAKPGNLIADISEAIESTIKGAGYTPIKALVGHGVGRELHEEPAIPCFSAISRNRSPKIVPGMALAIEVMYTQGSPEIGIAEDGWTIAMRDGKISGLFEETVAVTEHGPIVLTEGTK